MGSDSAKRRRRQSAVDRRHIASLGGVARRRSLEAARRVRENFTYAVAVLELQGGPRRVVRMKTFAGPLPGLYPARAGRTSR